MECIKKIHQDINEEKNRILCFYLFKREILLKKYIKKFCIF